MLPVDVAQGGNKAGKPGPGGPTGGPAAAQAAAGVAAARRQAGQQGALDSGASGGGLLGTAPQRGQLGAVNGPRAALPGSDQGGGPGGARGPQSGPSVPPQGRPAPAGAGMFGDQAPGAPRGLTPAGTGGPQNIDDSGRQGGFAGGGSGLRPGGSLGGSGFAPPRQGGFGEEAPSAGSPSAAPPEQRKERSGRHRPQLPAPGGPRAELPGGNPQPRTPSWSDENARPPVRASLDVPRGHNDPDATSQMPRFDDRQNPGPTEEMPRFDDRQSPEATSGFPRPDLDVPRPGLPQNGTGPFVRPDVFGGSGTDQSAAPGYGSPQDRSSTGRFEQPEVNGEADFGTPPPPAPQRPPAPPQQRHVRPREPEALPPATGPGDGRTPLYDRLETNWFRGGQDQQGNRGDTGNGGQSSGSAPSQIPAADRRPAGAPAASSWRPAPSDELVRQAERVRQPSAGGVTTSGLPRRVPRANLVPGTAQQQQHQSGPQVSRAPDDVRGRLTNLRRGIAQGRQAGTGQTGDFPSPTHQQEH
jgi:hypothetical protein